MPLKLSVAEKKPRFFTITLTGSLDTSTHMQLDDKIDQLLNEGAARIITLDMSGVKIHQQYGCAQRIQGEKGACPAERCLSDGQSPATSEKGL